MSRIGTMFVLAAAGLSACGGGAPDRAKAPGCYDRPSLDGNVTAIAPTGHPAQACAAAWRRGDVSTATRRAPRLVVCVGRNGTPLVFPVAGRNLCGTLGLRAA
jgi:hypothetical protein